MNKLLGIKKSYFRSQNLAAFFILNLIRITYKVRVITVSSDTDTDTVYWPCQGFLKVNTIRNLMADVVCAMVITHYSTHILCEKQEFGRQNNFFYLKSWHYIASLFHQASWFTCQGNNCTAGNTTVELGEQLAARHIG